MKSQSLAAAMLCGGNREGLIADAIKSCQPFCDHFVLIDTGPSAKAAIELAIEMLGVHCSVFQMPEPFDTATGRNFALDRAHELGFDWAIIVDTDERIRANPCRLRKMLDEIEVDAILIYDANLVYKKNKFFRLPRRGAWDGDPHEGFLSTTPTALAHGIVFEEIPKSEADLLAVQREVERKTREALVRNPEDARMHYYRGDALACLRRNDEAVESFLNAAKYTTWGEEREWSHYRAALVRFSEFRYQDAFDILLGSSMTIPEQAWLAALILHNSDMHQDAITAATECARLAELQRNTERRGFANRFTWYEGAFDVQRWSYHALGDREREAIAYLKCQAMAEERREIDRKLTCRAA